MGAIELALGLILLHGPDGRELYINPEAITTMRAATIEKNKVITDSAKCVLNTTDGKFIAVVESCDKVRKLMEKPSE
jgi:uncharacterized protein YlzI (FlbEa/FlbD family)